MRPLSKLNLTTFFENWHDARIRIVKKIFYRFMLYAHIWNLNLHFEWLDINDADVYNKHLCPDLGGGLSIFCLHSGEWKWPRDNIIKIFAALEKEFFKMFPNSCFFLLICWLNVFPKEFSYSEEQIITDFIFHFS